MENYMKHHNKLNENNIILKKKALRKNIKNIISQIDEITRENNSKLLASNFIKTKEFINSSLILLFQSLNDEISMEKLIQECLKENKTIAFPRIHEDEMDFFIIDNTKEFSNQFETNKWNILEPKTNLKKLDFKDFSKNTIILIPGLAFDTFGHRLGRGKGFYDKYLENISVLEDFDNIKLIGVCNEKQIIEKVPFENHDFFVKYLLSEVAFRKVMPYNLFYE